MPGAITTACFNQVQEAIQTPIVTMFYDGEGDLNRRVRVILANLRASLGLSPLRSIPPPAMTL